MGDPIYGKIQPGKAEFPNDSAVDSGSERTNAAATRMRVIGDVVGLMLSSPIYRNLLISDIEWRILSPMAMGQCRLIRQGELPIAFVTWAKISPEVEKRITSMRDLRLTHADWASGERNCVIDIIALPQVVEAVLESIGQSIFAGALYTVRGLPPDQLAKMREILARSSKASEAAAS